MGNTVQTSVACVRRNHEALPNFITATKQGKGFRASPAVSSLTSHSVQEI